MPPLSTYVHLMRLIQVLYHCPPCVWHFFIPLHFFLSASLINLSVCWCPIFPYLPAVILCFLSFICGSHQTLAPDWFSCEQGCSGGPGTSSLSFEAPSHPGQCFSDSSLKPQSKRQGLDWKQPLQKGTGETPGADIKGPESSQEVKLAQALLIDCLHVCSPLQFVVQHHTQVFVRRVYPWVVAQRSSRGQLGVEDLESNLLNNSYWAISKSTGNQWCCGCFSPLKIDKWWRRCLTVTLTSY